jgi:WD40 repeat protein
LHAWNVECRCSLNQIHLAWRSILHLAFATNRDVVLAVAQGKGRSPEASPLILWDPANHAPEQIDLWITAHRVAMAPVGQVLVLAGASKDVLIVQLGARRSQTTLAFPEMVTALAFGPAHNPLLAVAWGTVLELRDGKTYHRRISCQGHRSMIHTIAFAPDGNTVLTGSADETVRAWDTHSGAARGDWKWDLGAIQSVSVAADGMTAAAGGERSDLLVWDLDGV